jgi:RNA polymerase sigma factor (sigma-70 family)
MRPGASATSTFTVSDDDTARALGSGDLPVLATPRLLAWCEAATCATVADALAPGSTTVGTRVRLEHTAASAVGAEIRVTATLGYVDGRLLRFEVVAVQGGDERVVGHGEVTRVVVDATADRSADSRRKSDGSGHRGVMSGRLGPLIHVRPDLLSPAAGGSDREDLVRRNLPLVGHLVREAVSRAPGRVADDDFRAAGMQALVRAAESFDPERDGGFTGYASTRIRGALVAQLRGVDWAGRRPERTHDTAGHQTGRQARPQTGEQTGEQTGQQRDESLSAAVHGLPDRLRSVVEGYFFAGRPTADLAVELGISEGEVVQLRTEAVRLLGGALGAPSVSRAARSARTSFYAGLAAHRGAAGRVPSWPSAARRPA